MSYTITHEITFAYGKDFASRFFHVAKGHTKSLSVATWTVDLDGFVVGHHLGSRDESLREFCDDMGPSKGSYITSRKWRVQNWVAPQEGEIWNGPIINSDRYIATQPNEVQAKLKDLRTNGILVKSSK